MKPLQSATVAAPGFYGLNTQESSVTLQAGFALVATNCVIDKYGRLGARKGWEYLTTSGGTSTDLQGVHEFIDIDGTSTTISWSDTTFYTGTATLTTPTDNSTAFTSSNFSSATLNDKAYFAQAGEEIRYYDPVGNTFEDISTAGNTVTNLPNISGANVALSAYGRLWVADTDTNKSVIYWSDLLDGTNFDSGSAGSLDLSAILVNGNDEIIGLGAHAGRLIVFCKSNVVIFQDTDADSILDPTSMRLVEVIQGTGCIARDSVQNTGSDILFLSAAGVMSLGRLIQEKSQPMRDISSNIRDELVQALSVVDATTIRSLYSLTGAFYLLYIPLQKQIYCFDMRSPLQSGASRVTVWDGQTHNNISKTQAGILFCREDGLGVYKGYADNGEGYTLKYFTTYFDFDDATKIKILKRIGATVIGGSGQSFTLKAGFDYEDSYTPYPITLEELTNYEYGVAEYGISEYTVGTLVDQVRASLGGDGSVIQVGLEAEIKGFPLSIQRFDIYVKQGRTF
jgi:hypothetical protein